VEPLDGPAIKNEWSAKAGLPPPACGPSDYRYSGGGPIDVPGDLISCPMPGDLEGIVRIAAEQNYSDVHLVFGTMHTNSAVRTIERVHGMFPPSEQEAVRRGLSDSPLGIVAQGLIKTTDGKRTAFHDILISNDTCRDYIQKGQLDAIEQIMERSGFEGMQTSNQALSKMAQEGLIETADALAQSLKPAELKQALRGRQ